MRKELDLEEFRATGRQGIVIRKGRGEFLGGGQGWSQGCYYFRSGFLSFQLSRRGSSEEVFIGYLEVYFFCVVSEMLFFIRFLVAYIVVQIDGFKCSFVCIDMRDSSKQEDNLREYNFFRVIFRICLYRDDVIFFINFVYLVFKVGFRQIFFDRFFGVILVSFRIICV